MEVSYAAGTATTLRFAHSEIDVGGVDGLGASETDVSSILEDAQSASEDMKRSFVVSLGDSLVP